MDIEYLNKDLSVYDEPNESVVIDFMNRKIQEIIEKYGSFEHYPLTKIYIKNNKPIIEDKIVRYYSKSKDTRYGDIIGMLSETCKRYKIPNMYFYIFISDRTPYKDKELCTYPIFTLAKPRNKTYLIFPETTFYCISTTGLYKKDCKNWDQMKAHVRKNCKFPIIDVTYFHGRGTGHRHMDVRNRMRTLLNSPKFKIEITTEYNDLSDWCRYKTLLNLPGHYPWSNRLKYLLLTNSYVIDVNVKTVNQTYDYVEDEFVTFINYITPINNQITVTYYINEEDTESAAKMNEAEIVKLADTLKNYEPQPTIKKYINDYTMENMYNYIYTALIGIAKVTKQI